ncbi:putative phosphoglycerate mutase, AP superfamily [Desulfitobacterium dehalogenans ATCC 51507]|uniref:Putative phosphoglycerate mutase, AP superfamily n=1 Tax=Desulfitobacterium dehalogenans (strain ATCC 51507 / DSM 9161 / JW/IU-DC1) TaxID=756499 RepID=I4A404_DESDJ|nr:alkaline phosphatase family protein [Desulfitobacterium dehalogenans]AFL98688.1 putative phosphoglycerate mutase, AP superfamily [Desulfitobacterium dehalogenans ATCC 51507]
MHFVMIFLDGFGLGTEQDNPIVAARTPHLDELLGGHLLWGHERRIKKEHVFFTPLDPSLAVTGIPQSATGQTTLWTGINGAKALGFHLNAYPNEKLAEIIREKSIFKQLADQGKKVTFANTFTRHYDEIIASGKRRHTASTLSALAGGVRLRQVEDLLQGKGVYQDMTNEILGELEQEADIPIIAPYEAGQNLGRLALDYDFTLYEFFQTDVRGHKQDWEKAVALVEQIDEFIGGFMDLVRHEDVAWLLTSDHGNIEDFSVKGHTQNPVPALGWSNKPVEWPQWERLEDVTPGIVRMILGMREL